MKTFCLQYRSKSEKKRTEKSQIAIRKKKEAAGVFEDHLTKQLYVFPKERKNDEMPGFTARTAS